MSGDLVAFLRARLSEDEQAAYAATPGHNAWTAYRMESISGASVYDDQWRLVSAPGYDHDQPMSNRPGATGPGYINDDILMAHIARHDPALVLAEVEAKRRIIDLHSQLKYSGGGCRTCISDRSDFPEGWVADEAPCGTLRLLALPYAGHLSYDEAWRP